MITDHLFFIIAIVISDNGDTDDNDSDEISDGGYSFADEHSFNNFIDMDKVEAAMKYWNIEGDRSTSR